MGTRVAQLCPAHPATQPRGSVLTDMTAYHASAQCIEQSRVASFDIAVDGRESYGRGDRDEEDERKGKGREGKGKKSLAQGKLKTQGEKRKKALIQS